MKCQVCQFDLSAGATFCTNCGTPVPSNPYGGAGSSSSPAQGIAPTMLASAPSPDPYAPPPPVNPYGAPSTNYGASVPPPANPYNVPPSTPYGTPPPPNYNPNSAFGVPGAYSQPQYVPQQPKKSNGCLIAAIITISLVVLVIGGVVALASYSINRASTAISHFNATATSSLSTVTSLDTPTADTSGNTGEMPSTSQIDSTARANIPVAQTSLGVDSNYRPTHVTSSFTSGQTVDIALVLSGHTGYVTVKIYLDGSYDTQSDSPLAVDDATVTADFPFTSVNTGDFVAGVYWCDLSSCSDAALAQVVEFTIS